MLKRIFVCAPLFLVFSLGTLNAQSVCPLNGTLSGKLVCTVPQVHGGFGLGSGATAPLLADGHEAHFEGDFLSSFGPINEAAGMQVSQLLIASPSSGVTLVYDPSLKTFAPFTEESLYATHGLTRRLDLSIAVPILNVSMNASSAARKI
jgi:hypothetical protein